MVLPKLKLKIRNKETKFFLFIVDGNPLGNYHLHPPGRDNFFQCPSQNQNNSTNANHIFYY